MSDQVTKVHRQAETQMQDPNLLAPTDFEYYVQRPGVKRDWSRPSEAELVKSVNTAHMFVRQLVTEKDLLRRKMTNTIRWQRIWIKILGAGITGAWALSLLELKILLEHAHKW